MCCTCIILVSTDILLSGKRSNTQNWAENEFEREFIAPVSKNISTVIM